MTLLLEQLCRHYLSNCNSITGIIDKKDLKTPSPLAASRIKSTQKRFILHKRKTFRTEHLRFRYLNIKMVTERYACLNQAPLLNQLSLNTAALPLHFFIRKPDDLDSVHKVNFYIKPLIAAAYCNNTSGKIIKRSARNYNSVSLVKSNGNNPNCTSKLLERLHNIKTITLIKIK